jgi:hypothetical protein
MAAEKESRGGREKGETGYEIFTLIGPAYPSTNSPDTLQMVAGLGPIPSKKTLAICLCYIFSIPEEHESMQDKPEGSHEQAQADPSPPPLAPIPPANPPPVPPIGGQGTTSKSGDEQPHNPPPEDKLMKNDKVMIALTIAIALGTIVSAGAIVLQWREMVGGGKQTDKIIAAANINADAATKSAKAAQDFATNAGHINTAMGKAVEKLNLQAAATKSVADQALSQAAIATGQLQVMQTDERAWLEFRIPQSQAAGDAGLPMASGQPLDLPIQVMNSGKTVARNVVIDVFVEILDASQEASLENVYELANHKHERGVTGTIFPNADYKLQVTRRWDKGGIGPVTVPELTSLHEGRSYISTYGIITYDDVFNKHHWTKFCMWGHTPKGAFNAKTCTAFNSVGDN